MDTVKLVKPNRELAIKLDYMLCIKNKIDWKRAYVRMCILDGKTPIPQGEKSDEEYYKLVSSPRFQYYLLNGEDVVGRAVLSERGENWIDIQYISIEKEFRSQGYGTKFFQMLENYIFQNDQIEGIFVEDKSSFGQTTKIAKKLGYEENEYGQFIKYKNSKLKKNI